MFKTPTVAQLRDCAADLGMNPSDDYLESTQAIVGPLVDAYRQLGVDVFHRLREFNKARVPGRVPFPIGVP